MNKKSSFWQKKGERTPDSARERAKNESKPVFWRKEVRWRGLEGEFWIYQQAGVDNYLIK